MTDQDMAYTDYQKGMKYKDIAGKYNVSINTVKSWKRRNDWQRKKGAHKKKKGAPFLNGNAKGNRGGPGGPAGNHKAATHGLFAKYLPAETLAIIEQVEESSPLDLLWGSICIKYAAIIRAQKIMNVADADDCTKRVIADGLEVTSYSYQEAWDKQGAFLQAQARAMGTLNSMIKQYEEMCKSEAATEEQQLRIAKLRIEVDALKSGQDKDDDVRIIDDLEVNGNGCKAE